MEATVVIKPFPSDQPRDLSATSRYMMDRDNDGAKVPLDDNGTPMSGAINCVSDDRSDQINEMETLLKLHGNPRSTQAAQHCVLSYPAGVRPTREQIERDLRINLKKQGMDDHLLIWDAHDNTDHFHVHFLLCRVVPYSEFDKYPLANNGLVKVTRKDKRGNVRTRTDEAACRQSAIAEINELYGYGTDGLTHDKDGKPQPRQKQKDRHSDRTRAGERKTGKKSKERQISEIAQKIFASSKSWRECDQIFASFAIEMTFKVKAGKIVGGYITGPDNRKCSFSKCGPGCAYPALEARFGIPSANDAACVNEYYLMPFEYKDLLTQEEVKKRLLSVFKDAQSWPHLLSDIQSLGMSLDRSGGGLIVRFNDNSDCIKCSEISNKFSLSKLEKTLGPCPIHKAAPAPTARDLLIQDAKAILEKHVPQGHGLHWIEPDLTHASIQIVQKTFPNDVGQQQNYWCLERGGVSVPLSSIAKSPNGNRITMRMLERLDDQDTTVLKVKRLEAQRRKFEEINRRCAPGGDLYELYIADAIQKKERKINHLSFFAAVAKFLNLKHSEKKDVYSNSSDTNQQKTGVGSTSQAQSLFQM